MVEPSWQAAGARRRADRFHSTAEQGRLVTPTAARPVAVTAALFVAPVGLRSPGSVAVGLGADRAAVAIDLSRGRCAVAIDLGSAACGVAVGFALWFRAL